VNLFFSEPGTVVNSAALPSGLFLTGWSYAILNLYFPDTIKADGDIEYGEDFLNATLTSITRVSVVPLPTALQLYGAGIAGHGFHRLSSQAQSCGITENNTGYLLNLSRLHNSASTLAKEGLFCGYNACSFLEWI